MQNIITQKVRELFASMAIYKDPASTNSLFAGRNLPSFVKDFILKRYINEDGSVNREALTSFLVNPAKRNVLDLKNETCKNLEKRNVLKNSRTRHFKITKKQSKTGCFYSF